jgi:alanyl aminopeptidase
MRRSLCVVVALVGFIVLAACAGTGTNAPSSASLSSAPTSDRAPSSSVGNGPALATAEPQGGRLPRDVTPVAQSIELDVDPRREEYTGAVVVDVVLSAPRRTIWLHARDLTVDVATVTAQGVSQAARFAIVDAEDGVARLDVDTPVPAGRAQLALTFRAAVRKDLEGLYGVRAPGPDGVVDAYVFSQFEALAAREAFPCFDEPGWKIPFSVSVTHPGRDEAIANTKRTLREPLQDGRMRDRFATTAPLPTYLLAFVVGPVDIVDGTPVPPSSWRPAPLPVRAITVRGRGVQVKKALVDTAAVLAQQERMFGIGYPYDKLDIVAVPDFSAGAMENAGLVTFRDTLLFVDDNSPIAAQKASLATIAHELAHQWFGNLVTMAWWDDLWLNEAFASWFEVRTTQQLRPDFDRALEQREGAAWVMGEDSLVSARRIREPIDDRGDIEGAFDGITYTKGSAVIAMFEEYIDHQTKPGTFMAGVTGYLNAHRFGSGTTADFLAAISAAAGFDIAPSFSTFLDQPGVPLLRATCSMNGGAAGLDITSERFLPVGSQGDKNKRWDIPVCVSFKSGGKLQKRCTLLAGGAGGVALGEKKCPAAVHPNADGAGYYRFTMPAAELKALSTSLWSLSAGERVSFGMAVRGGFAAATMPYADVLAAARPLAAEVEDAVALTPFSLLQFAREDVLATDAARARVDVELVRLYQPALNKLGFVDRAGDTPKDRERRATLFSVVVDAHGAARIIAVAAGRELFATGTTKRVAQDLWPVALAAAVDDGAERKTVDAATWDAWLKAAKTQADPRLRRYMLAALAATKDPSLGERALGMIFDDELKVAELGTGLFAQAGQRETRARAFSFVTMRWDDVTKRLPEGWRPALASAFDGYCSVEDAAQVEGFFLQKVPSTPGLDRALAQATENIRLCAAKQAAHGDAVRALFLEKNAATTK